MSQETLVCTPMITAVKLADQDSDLMTNDREYHSVVGDLLYVCHARPDIGFAVNKVAQFMLCVKVFSDTDWAGDASDRRSMTGYCVFLGYCLVAWNSNKQKIVSRSIIEAEYRSVADSAVEFTWLTVLLRGLGISFQDEPLVSFELAMYLLVFKWPMV
ncbi:uncharacterized mitochondrial protein AtMg00810-like [Hibiscus syriacus]|uniref:uncharacterized mitochondrial protein AtMg00810-like n=1 Tax=Hibiscus syriacus TaxID=106335 RepID=UPI00192476C2|nr:uncharacterized mitochondrial protein AtMg00810-like [Hibiscus syriacus]